MSESFSFTSESVTEGHPDKMADQISDAVLDAILAAGPAGRVACETFLTTGPRARRRRDHDVRVRRHPARSFASEDRRDRLHARGVRLRREHLQRHRRGRRAVARTSRRASTPRSRRSTTPDDDDPLDRVGAGDQGMMFGYACRETDELMPLPITLAHKICKRLAEVRKADELALPPARRQGAGDRALRGRRARAPAPGRDRARPHLDAARRRHRRRSRQIKPDLIERVLLPILPRDLYDEARLEHKDFVYVNPTGRFVVGGPMGDTGLTGRKIIVDTYGGAARHGGGAFSGKDPTKVDRSAAYAARYVAKNVVAAGLADRCELQVAYAIGVAQPFSIQVECFGTEHVPVARIEELIREHFDLRPAAILRDLDLRRPIYAKTAAYGHFGRDDPDFTWERTDKADALRAAAGPRRRDAAKPSDDGSHRRRLGRVRRARDAVRQARAHPRRRGDALLARGELLHRRPRGRRRRRGLRRGGARRLPARGINIDDVEQVAGARSFFWAGRYDDDMQVAHTLDTQLNVFADFDPVLSRRRARARRSLFLANIQPDLQRRVREQCTGAALVGLDSMNYWIESARDVAPRRRSRTSTSSSSTTPRCGC